MKPTKTLLAAGAIALGLGAATAFTFDGQQYAKEAKVTLAQARRTAWKVLPGGTITAEELEYEHGGSGLPTLEPYGTLDA